MRFLRGTEEIAAMKFIDEAAKIAMASICLRSKCGSVIVKNGEIIGKGFNSPPLNKPPAFASKTLCQKISSQTKHAAFTPSRGR
jgi:deoxycytidylate deaminase